MSYDPRIVELLAEGLTLPYPPDVIARLEDTSAVVDLRTGAILPGEADTPYHHELTVIGEATAIVLQAEEGTDL
jgi:hypothetical protein